MLEIKHFPRQHRQILHVYTVAAPRFLLQRRGGDDGVASLFLKEDKNSLYLRTWKILFHMKMISKQDWYISKCNSKLMLFFKFLNLSQDPNENQVSFLNKGLFYYFYYHYCPFNIIDGAKLGPKKQVTLMTGSVFGVDALKFECEFAKARFMTEHFDTIFLRPTFCRTLPRILEQQNVCL